MADKDGESLLLNDVPQSFRLVSLDSVKTLVQDVINESMNYKTSRAQLHRNLVFKLCSLTTVGATAEQFEELKAQEEIKFDE